MNTRPDSKNLLQVKAEVSERFLGKLGIHSIGCRHSNQTIRVYASPGDDRLLPEMDQLQNEVRPFQLEVILEQSPSIQHSVSGG